MQPLPQAHLLAPLLSSFFTSPYHTSVSKKSIDTLINDNISVFREKNLSLQQTSNSYLFLFFIKPDFIDNYVALLSLNDLKEIKDFHFSLKIHEIKIIEHYPSCPVRHNHKDKEIELFLKHLNEDIVKKEKETIEKLIPVSAIPAISSIDLPVENKIRNKI